MGNTFSGEKITIEKLCLVGEGSQKFQADVLPPIWKRPSETTDAETLRWRARAEPVYERMYERCKAVDEYPHIGELVEIINEDQAPYAKDFFSYFPHYVHETRTEHEGFLGEYYSLHVVPQRGSASRIASSSDFCLLLPFVCHRPRAVEAARPLTKESMVLRFMQCFMGSSGNTFYEIIYPPSSKNKDSFTISPPKREGVN